MNVREQLALLQKETTSLMVAMSDIEQSLISLEERVQKNKKNLVDMYLEVDRLLDEKEN
jgi:hypothetical protein